MSIPSPSVTDIQSWWEIPYIAHSCFILRDILKLPDFEIEELEDAVLSLDASNDNKLIASLVSQLLKFEYKKNIEKRFESYIKLYLNKYCPVYDVDNLIPENEKFFTIPLYARVCCISTIIDFRLYNRDIHTLLSKLSIDDLSLKPIGCDKNGYAYWYFHGLRLYRDLKKHSNNGKKPKLEQWAPICYKFEDWNSLYDTLNKSTGADLKIAKLIQEKLTEIKEIQDKINKDIASRTYKRRLRNPIVTLNLDEYSYPRHRYDSKQNGRTRLNSYESDSTKSSKSSSHMDEYYVDTRSNRALRREARSKNCGPLD